MHMQKNKSDTDFPPLTEINSKQITDQNVKHKTVKLEDNIGENPDDLGFRNDFLDTTPKGKSTNKRIYKLQFIKTKFSSL